MTSNGQPTDVPRQSDGHSCGVHNRSQWRGGTRHYNAASMDVKRMRQICQRERHSKPPLVQMGAKQRRGIDNSNLYRNYLYSDTTQACLAWCHEDEYILCDECDVIGRAVHAGSALDDVEHGTTRLFLSVHRLFTCLRMWRYRHPSQH